MLPLKRWVSRKLRRFIRDALRGQAFRRAIHRISKLPPGEIPERSTLQELRISWRNEGFTADLDYLQELVRRAASTAGPVPSVGVD